MVVLNARQLTIGQARRLLNFEPRTNGAFIKYLQLKPLTTVEQDEALNIAHEFESYLFADAVSEGQVRAMSIAPLLRLAGYHQPEIELRIEENIARIDIADEDTYITGRFDIVAVHRAPQPTLPGSNPVPLWILVIESKNSEASDSTGIAQMLVYAHKSLESQGTVWGLVTNGDIYQFFRLQKGEPSIYEYMPSLNMREDDRTLQLLQVLKAIRED
jgi:hypothetical protein